MKGYVYNFLLCLVFQQLKGCLDRPLYIPIGQHIAIFFSQTILLGEDGNVTDLATFQGDLSDLLVDNKIREGEYLIYPITLVDPLDNTFLPPVSVRYSTDNGVGPELAFSFATFPLSYRSTVCFLVQV
jgi:hypothetical protein